MIQSLTPNEQRPIAVSPPANDTELAPLAPVLHRVLTILPSSTDHHLIFAAMKPPRRPRRPDETIEAYAEDVAANPTVIPHQMSEMTPYDINPTERCYLLLELDQSINWQYTPLGRGVTAKADAFDHENYGLRFVPDRGRVQPAGALAPPCCHVLYFGLLRRKKVDGIIERGFNFEIEFYQTSDGALRRLPTIFDPNVPNTGGSEFP